MGNSTNLVDTKECNENPPAVDRWGTEAVRQFSPDGKAMSLNVIKEERKLRAYIMKGYVALNKKNI